MNKYTGIFPLLNKDKYPEQIGKCARIINSFYSKSPLILTREDFETRWEIEEDRITTLVSACLCGHPCRYKGTHAQNNEMCDTFTLSNSIKRNNHLVWICPEVYAGLPTPREACEGPINGKIFSASGKDYTELFNIGATKVLQTAFIVGAKEFVGKSGSPSCGVGKIHDGTFTGTTIYGDGITAALLRVYGLRLRCI